VSGGPGPAARQALVLCRCERVTLGEVERAVAELDIGSLRQLKLWTRAGMGICQGRVCRPALEGLAAALGLARGEGELRLRPPLRPLALSDLAGEDGA